MRPVANSSASRFATYLLALSVALMGGSSAGSEETTADIKALQQKRVKVLGQLCDVAQKLWEQGRGEFQEVLVAKRELLAARLEYADTKQDRLKICDEAIANAQQMRELAETNQKLARGTPLVVLRAEAYLLETQIARVKLEESK